MIPNDEKMDWTAEAIATLRSLWDEGHTTAEIGRRMKVSKNTIVGKAHRLELPSRPSPIRGTPRQPAEPVPCIEAAAPKRFKPVIHIVAPLRRIAPLAVAVAATSPLSAPAPAPAPAPRHPPLVARPQPRPQHDFASRRHGGCQWPIGEPGRPDFRFCGDEPMPGKPYCPDHCGHAYVGFRTALHADVAS